MSGSVNESNATNKTSERIFPARTLVKSPQVDVDNPFNSFYSRSKDANVAKRNSLSAMRPQGPGRTASRDLSPGALVVEGTGSDTEASSEPSDSANFPDERPLHKSFRQMERVEDNRGKEKVHDVASTEPVEHDVEAQYEFRTQRFQYREGDDGSHQVLTGIDDNKVQACEDEPIHIPGAVQGYGVLMTLRQIGSDFQVIHVSENSGTILGLPPKYLFGLKSFFEVLPEESQLAFSDQLEFLESSNSSDFGITIDNTSSSDVEANVSPEVFLLTGHQDDTTLPMWKCWTAIHRTIVNGDLILVEFEHQKDAKNPLTYERTTSDPKLPVSRPDQEPERGIFVGEKNGMVGEGFDAFSEEDLLESTVSASQPLRRIKRSVLAGNDDGTMEIFSLLSQMNGQLSSANDLQGFLKIVAGLVKEITGLHRVMIYQFDEQFNGQVVAELVDWTQTKDLFQGLSFPATDIPVQARQLYKINKVRTLYDRDQPTARLVCRNKEALDVPVDMTHCFLRAMSPIHLKYLANMGVRSSMSISITAFGELWGLIACHSYGETAMRCSFLIRKLCRLMGEQVSHNIERLSYAARLTARKLIHTPSANNPSGYIVSKAEDLLGLFDADIGMLSIGEEGKLLGAMENSQEAIALREYFRSKRFETITPSSDLKADFPDLQYGPGFKTIAGVMYIPLSRSGEDFLLFFRRGQLRKVHWAGNPYEKIIEKNKGQASVLLPRQSFKVWSESVVGRCKEWGEDQIETAAVLCLVYGKFIEVWREKQQALQTSKLTSLLLNNAGHEVRTPLNAVINYLEIAMEGQLPDDVRDNLEKSHTASKSLVYVINDLLDLTKSEQGHDLFRTEPFDFVSTIREAVSMYKSQAVRSAVTFSLEEDPRIPRRIIGDQAKIRQVVSNVTANALKYTTKGTVTVETKVLEMDEETVQIAIMVTDTGCGISEERLDAIFSNFELIESTNLPESQDGSKDDYGTGLGLAIVARVVRNMNGQLKAVSKVGRGSTFTFIFHFNIADETLRKQSVASQASTSTARMHSVAGPKESKTSDHARDGNDDANSQISETSHVEVDPVSGQRSWPSDQKHQEAVDRVVLQRRNSADSKSSLIKQQIYEMQSRTSDNQGSPSQADIDGIMTSMIATPLPTSDSRNGSHESTFTRAPGSASGTSDHSRKGRIEDSSRARAGSSGVNDSITLYSAKQEQRHREDHNHGHGSSQLHDPRHEPNTLSDLDEGSETSGRMSQKIVNTTPAHRHMRGVKLESSEVSIPSRYTHNASGRNALTPGTRQGTKKPIALENGHSSAPDQGPSAQKARPLNILVAEDDAINRSIIQKRLQIDKHKIKLAFHGADCYEEFAKDTTKYDVILMDMQMPVLDGMGATRKIRELEKQRLANRKDRVPIIAVSASLLQSQANEAIEAGIDGWILKPVNFARLKEFFEGLQDSERRRRDLYTPDSEHVWEKGGWLTDLEQEGES